MASITQGLLSLEESVQEDRGRSLRVQIFVGIVAVVGVIIALAALRYSHKPKLASATTTSSTETGASEAITPPTPMGVTPADQAPTTAASVGVPAPAAATEAIPPAVATEKTEAPKAESSATATHHRRAVAPKRAPAAEATPAPVIEPPKLVPVPIQAAPAPELAPASPAPSSAAPGAASIPTTLPTAPVTPQNPATSTTTPPDTVPPPPPPPAS